MFDWLWTAGGIAALAAVFSAVATGLAAWTAYYGPQKAAELAERLRKDGDAHAEKRRAKLHVFAVLMANRQSYWTGDAVNMFNVIDVVFNDCQEVRSAWAEMYLSFPGGIPDHVRHEKMRKLLGAMAKDLHLADELRTDDFGRIYRPDAVVEEQLVQMYQRRAALAAFEGKRSPSANTTGPEGALSGQYPPKPE